MLRKYLDVEKIIKAYTGDYTWLEELESQVNKIDTENVEEFNVLYDVKELITTLFHMLTVVVETETKEYASEFNSQAQELYSRMKIKLTEMLGIEDMWEAL